MRWMTIIAILLTSTVAVAGELKHERTGTSMMKQKSLPNALVAAHFECNKKRLWANLDTMEVGPTVSDRSRRPTYRTTVKFECATHYERYLPEDRVETVE